MIHPEVILELTRPNGRFHKLHIEPVNKQQHRVHAWIDLETLGESCPKIILRQALDLFDHDAFLSLDPALEQGRLRFASGVPLWNVGRATPRNCSVAAAPAKSLRDIVGIVWFSVRRKPYREPFWFFDNVPFRRRLEIGLWEWALYQLIKSGLDVCWLRGRFLKRGQHFRHGRRTHWRRRNNVSRKRLH